MLILKVIKNYLSESTIHGLTHLTGEHRLYVKLLWAAAFLASLCCCSLRIAESYRRFAGAEVATTIDANSLEFKFPDMYVCSDKPISGSYSVSLGSEDRQLLRGYRALVNASLDGLRNNASTDTVLINYALQLVHSLPVNFLVHKLGHRWMGQNYIKDFTSATTEIFYHPFHISCLKLTWPAEQKIELQSVVQPLVLHLLVFLDQQPHPHFATSSDPDIHLYGDAQFDLQPFNLDFKYGFDYTSAEGLRLYIVPKGHYPSEFETNVLAGPGQNHNLVLQMKQVKLIESDFVGRCIPNRPDNTLHFVNPYSRAKDSFQYSQAVCWYREIARLSQDLFNCTVWPTPLPWEFRHLPSCFNVTGYARNRHSTRTFLTSEVYGTRSTILSTAMQRCEDQNPCKRQQYSVEHSTNAWPNKQIFYAYVSPMIRHFFLGNESIRVPGLRHLVDNSSFADARESLLQISLSSKELRSSQTQLALAYSFNSLIADIGGLLGLFMGMSLLSLMELLELLHDCVLLAIQQRQRPNCCYGDKTTSYKISECDQVRSCRQQGVVDSRTVELEVRGNVASMRCSG